MRFLLKSCVLTALAIALLVLDTTSSYANDATLVKECDAGSMARCEDLTRLYGAGASENPVKWAAYAEKACNLNSAGACNNLGAAWSRGHRPFQVDLAKGHAYYRKACGLSHGIGCFNFANMHRLKACDLAEAKGCTELGIMYYEGKVVTKDDLMTLTLFQKGCELGSGTACKNLDVLLGRPK